MRLGCVAVGVAFVLRFWVYVIGVATAAAAAAGVGVAVLVMWALRVWALQRCRVVERYWME